jgi:hypothetical protein
MVLLPIAPGTCSQSGHFGTSGRATPEANRATSRQPLVRRSSSPRRIDILNMCDMIPNAEHWRVSVWEAQELQHPIMGYLPGYATPRIV